MEESQDPCLAMFSNRGCPWRPGVTRIGPWQPFACRIRRLNGATCLPWVATRVGGILVADVLGCWL